jgi:transcriptional regulator with XRE-family HTH domain
MQIRNMNENPLYKYRVAQGVSQTWLASYLGVANSTIARWESGERKISPDKIQAVARLTGIQPRKLRPDLYGALERVAR